jgi:hypothetical protein
MDGWKPRNTGIEAYTVFFGSYGTIPSFDTEYSKDPSVQSCISKLETSF